MRVKEESEKASLKLNIKKKLRSRHPIPSLYGKQKGKSGRSDEVEEDVFLGSKITKDSDCSHEIKRPLLLGRKAMTNLDSDITLLRHQFGDKGPYSQRYGFSSSHVQCES